MAISVLDNQKTSLETVLDSNTFSLTRTKANSHTTAFSLGFETFHPKVLGVMTQEIQLQMQTAQAEAIVSAAGEALSDAIDLVGQVVLLACGGDRTAALYVLLFGTQRPSAVKKRGCGVRSEGQRCANGFRKSKFGPPGDKAV